MTKGDEAQTKEVGEEEEEEEEEERRSTLTCRDGD
jgi:hypothetical protein